MENKSIWSRASKTKKKRKLTKNIAVDVLIIGGGMTGLNTAFNLRNYKGKVALVEQREIGKGVSSRTTGKINYLQETIYQTIEKTYSFDIAKKYLQSQRMATRRLKSIIYKYKIKCDFDKTKSYVFTNDKTEKKKLIYEKELLEKMGIKVTSHSKIDNNFKCIYAISVNDTYVFNCVKYMNTMKDIISSSINIYENTRVQQIKKSKECYVCKTDNYEIRAKKVILACHYPFFLKPYFMPLKVSNEKSICIAARVNKYKKINYITSALPTKSIRYHKDKKNYLIYVSNSHLICDDTNDKKNIKKVLQDAKKINLKVDYLWTNDDLITVDRLPYIGPIEKDNNTLLIGTGYNTWGMANSVLAASILSDLVQGKQNEFAEIFNPLRVNICSDINEYLANIGHSTKSLISNKVVKNKLWYSDSVLFENRNGKNIATYQDEKGNKHTVLSTCPHMGCTLLFNEAEKTWDCPCHASRFNIDGKCIKGPSAYDISYKEE